MDSLPPYSVAIRTLGKAGDKYQTLLNSLRKQTHLPKRIFVYLAEGFEKPKETIGLEEIFYVKKGMVAQRALPYDEVDTEWILFLDDDVSIEPWGVEKMLSDTLKAGADVCSFDAFPHHLMPRKVKIGTALLLSSLPRFWGKDKGYTVNFLGMDIYNPKPKKDYAWSTTNAGVGFLCKKQDFLDIHFEEDLWLDNSPYAIPEDKVMFYKMHLNGLKILTHYNSGFFHLDAGTSVESKNYHEKKAKVIYSIERNNKIFFELYIKQHLSHLQNVLRKVIRPYSIFINQLQFSYAKMKGEDFSRERKLGIADAKAYLNFRSK